MSPVAIAKTIIKTENGTMYVMENSGLTRFSERPIIGRESLMVKDEPFIIHQLKVGYPAIFELMNIGGEIKTGPVTEITDYDYDGQPTDELQGEN